MLESLKARIQSPKNLGTVIAVGLKLAKLRDIEGTVKDEVKKIIDAISSVGEVDFDADFERGYTPLNGDPPINIVDLWAKIDGILDLNVDVMAEYLSTRRTGRLEISIGDSRVSVVKKLGSGGTKEVYRVGAGDREYALALPNIVDGAGRALEKWQSAMQEPENTARFREAGLKVNSTCKLVNINVNGVELSGILMDCYDQQPFEVRDSKNRTDANDSFLQDLDLDDESFTHLFAKVVAQVNILLNIGARIGSDCFNFCIVPDGTLELYFNDLGAAKFEKFPDEERRPYAIDYLRRIKGAFLNMMTENEYRKHKAYCDKIDSLAGSDEITNKLMEKIS